MGGLAVFKFKGEGNMIKREGEFSLPHFGRQDACHDIAKSADFQTKKRFSENDLIFTEILHTKAFIKPMTSD